jgi:hypothetical protein
MQITSVKTQAARASDYAYSPLVPKRHPKILEEGFGYAIDATVFGDSWPIAAADFLSGVAVCDRLLSKVWVQVCQSF